MIILPIFELTVIGITIFELTVIGIRVNSGELNLDKLPSIANPSDRAV